MYPNFASLDSCCVLSPFCRRVKVIRACSRPRTPRQQVGGALRALRAPHGTSLRQAPSVFVGRGTNTNEDTPGDKKYRAYTCGEQSLVWWVPHPTSWQERRKASGRSRAFCGGTRTRQPGAFNPGSLVGERKCLCHTQRHIKKRTRRDQQDQQLSLSLSHQLTLPTAASDCLLFFVGVSFVLLFRYVLLTISRAHLLVVVCLQQCAMSPPRG